MQQGEDNREAIVNYVSKQGNVIAKNVIKDLKISVHAANHNLNKLAEDGYLLKEFEYRGSFRYAVYTMSNKPFVKVDYSEEARAAGEITEESLREEQEEERMKKLRKAGISKVYRLTDKKRPPQPKEGKRKSSIGSLQSGITAFGSW